MSFGAIATIQRVLGNRKSAYQQVFSGEGAPKVVLGDLARFCHAQKSTFHKDPYVQAHLEGKREVWLRIQQHLNLSEEELFHLLQLNRQEGK